MNFKERINLVERIDQLIRLKATGTPKNLAKRLGLSETSVWRTISEMKEMKAPIVYCMNSQSYIYEEPVRFHFGFYGEELSEKEQKEIEGGVGFNNILRFYKNIS